MEGPLKVEKKLSQHQFTLVMLIAIGAIVLLMLTIPAIVALLCGIVIGIFAGFLIDNWIDREE